MSADARRAERLSDTTRLRVEVDGTAVSAFEYTASATDARTTFVLGHGAGAGQQHPFLVYFARALAGRMCNVVTFSFPYMEQGRRVPDPRARLEACYRAVVADLHRHSHVARPLVLGGKSLGGRVASHVAATDTDIADGLVFLGYPLHPPGKPQQHRSAHLGRIRVPMLFVQGTRDPFGTPEELRPILRALGPRASLCVVPNGDHSFHVPKASSLPQQHVYDDVVDHIVGWTSGALA